MPTDDFVHEEPIEQTHHNDGDSEDVESADTHHPKTYPSLRKLHRSDSMDLESAKVPSHHARASQVYEYKVSDYMYMSSL